MKTHTPGPWAFTSDRFRHYVTMPDRNSSYVFALADTANARLISAAPELLAACQWLLRAESMQQGKRDGGTMGEISLAIDKARAAIAKATP
jgi:hypothetical protein